MILGRDEPKQKGEEKLSTEAQNIHHTHIPGGRRSCPRQAKGWELPILIHELVLVSHQKHRQNQFHCQLGQSHRRAKVLTSSPIKEQIRYVRNWIGSQPPSWAILGRVRMVFGVQLHVTQSVREEICAFGYLFANFDVLPHVPSQHDFGQRDPLGLPDASTEYGERGGSL